MDKQKITKTELPQILKIKDKLFSNSSQYRAALNKKAFTQLKTMNENIEMMNNRLKFLSIKQNSLKKISEHFKHQSKIKLDELRSQSKKQISDILALNALKQQILLSQKKKVYKDRIKKNKQMIVKALLHKSAEKQRIYHEIKQERIQNRKRIHLDLQQIHEINKRKHDSIVKQQNQIKNKIQTLKVIKAEKIKKVCQAQIYPLLELIKQGQLKLNALKETCEKRGMKIKRSESNNLKKRVKKESRLIRRYETQVIQPKEVTYSQPHQNKTKKKTLQYSYEDSYKQKDYNDITKESSMYEFVIIT